MRKWRADSGKEEEEEEENKEVERIGKGEMRQSTRKVTSEDSKTRQIRNKNIILYTHPTLCLGRTGKDEIKRTAKHAKKKKKVESPAADEAHKAIF